MSSQRPSGGRGPTHAAPAAALPQFSVVIRNDIHAIVVKLRGQVSGDAVAQLDTVLGQLVADDEHDIVIDVRLAGFDSADALGPIVGAFEKLRRHGRELAVRDPDAETRKLLDDVGLRKTVQMVSH